MAKEFDAHRKMLCGVRVDDDEYFEHLLMHKMHMRRRWSNESLGHFDRMIPAEAEVRV